MLPAGAVAESTDDVCLECDAVTKANEVELTTELEGDGTPTVWALVVGVPGSIVLPSRVLQPTHTVVIGIDVITVTTSSEVEQPKHTVVTGTDATTVVTSSDRLSPM